MVTKEYRIPLSDVIYVVVMFVNALAYMYAVYYLFSDYSEVKFMYSAFSFLFLAVAVLYNSVNYKLSSVILHIISILFALKVVF
jgi:NADH:ubiquinone oxidoreductase subunit 5 (subunit L)/multisubunit Na+/H+ antiporter MnhA subunit